MAKVHVPVGPQPSLNLLPGDQVAGSREQQIEEVKRLSFEADRLALGREAAPLIVEFKISEGLHHGQTPLPIGSAIQILHV